MHVASDAALDTVCPAMHEANEKSWFVIFHDREYFFCPISIRAGVVECEDATFWDVVRLAEVDCFWLECTSHITLAVTVMFRVKDNDFFIAHSPGVLITVW
jgi:hypothetical protein